MKSKLFKIAFVVAIAMVASINVFDAKKSEVFSDIALANVEALAGFSRGTDIPCYEGGERCNFKFNDASGKEHNGYIDGMKNAE